MNHSIKRNTNEEHGNTKQDDRRRRSNMGWMVKLIANKSTKSPIVSRILEDIETRHGQITEFMNKNGFQNTLGKVEGPQSKSNFLRNVQAVIILSPIHKGADNRKTIQGIHDEGSQIFNNIACAEPHLGAKIFQQKGGLTNGNGGNFGLILQNCLTNNETLLSVMHFIGFGDLNFQFFDSRIR